MSYDIDLADPVTGKTIEFDEVHHIKGGTFALGGTNEATLNITYNYQDHYYKHIDSEMGIRFIYGKSGAESIPILEHAMSKLRNNASNNYWEPTEGNAKRALAGLLVFAKMRPDGIWKGD